MATALFHATVVAYAVSCALFLTQLGKTPPKWSSAAMPTLAVGALLHLAGVIAAAVVDGWSPVGGIQQALTAFSLGIAIAFWLVARKYRLAAVGAFVTPIPLLMLTSAHVGRVEPLSAGVRGMLLAVHITANLLGEIAFALAFAVAIAYLLQERRLKRKQLQGVFFRLPSLDVLDHLGLRCVTVGFPLLTIGIVLGAVVARRRGEDLFVSSEQILGLLMWIAFATVLALRATAGWRGRRAAIGTVLGFVLGAAVLVAYLVRSSSAGGA